MPAAISPAVGQAAMPALTLDNFNGQFSISSLLNKIANPVLEQQRQSQAIEGKNGLQKSKKSLEESLKDTGLLVEQFERLTTFRAKRDHLHPQLVH